MVLSADCNSYLVTDSAKILQQWERFDKRVVLAADSQRGARVPEELTAAITAAYPHLAEATHRHVADGA